jgi:mono/diheme cytochrome c family protein
MRKTLRWVGYGLGALLGLALLAAGWVWIASERALVGTLEGESERLERPPSKLLADGPRQLKILGCISCHGTGLRGKLMFEKKYVARIYAPNLTLVASTVSDHQLARAIRQGIGTDGRPLVIMPSAQYSRLTDAEVAALIAAVRAQPRGGRPTPPIMVGPLARLGLATGRLRNQPAEVERFKAALPADLGPEFEKGRHLTMTNCAECHGPALSGGEVEGRTAPDLSIVGAYDLAQFKRLMRDGVPPSKRNLGLMGEVARDDFSHFTHEEIEAIHLYLVERAERAP